MKAPDFAGASREVLSFLHQRIGMALWMVSRADNEDWVVLTAEDHGYGVARRATSSAGPTRFCSRMVRGEGPRVAPARGRRARLRLRCRSRSQLPVGAYVGVPLVDGEGAPVRHAVRPQSRSRCPHASPTSSPWSRCSPTCSAACSAPSSTPRPWRARPRPRAPRPSPTPSPAWPTAAAGSRRWPPRKNAAAATAPPPAWSAIELDGLQVAARSRATPATPCWCAPRRRCARRCASPTPWPASTTTASSCWASSAPPPRPWRCCAASSRACRAPTCRPRWAWPCATAAAACSTPSTARSTRWWSTGDARARD